MQVTRVHNQSLTLSNPFKAIDDDMLLGILRDKFIGRCYRECFVTDIVRIITKGDIIITRSYPPRGNIIVKFQIEGHVMPPGYIATDCEIVGISSGLIIIMNKYLHGMITMNNNNGFLKVGMKIPVRIINSRYNSEKITANCVLFTHAEKWPAYHIISGGSPDINWRELYEIARAADAEIAGEKYNDAKILATPVKSPAGAVIPIDQLEGTVCLSPSIGLTAVAAPASCSIIHCSKNEAAARIINDFIMYAGLVKFIGDTYNNKEAIDKHRLYILSLKNSKKNEP